VSRLRARCPDCRTLTAVALGEAYECHACGRTFEAGLVRVPRAWGADGEAMAEAAFLPLAFPEVAVVQEETLREQTLALAAALPDRPVVLGGCCCAHTGAVEGLAARHERLAVVWLDAHGDLNTPQSSPSGNPWGMPLRALLDGGTVEPGDTALVGARSLDPPEEDFIAESGIRLGADAVGEAIEGAETVYVAFDCDVLEPDQGLTMHMPEPGGLTLAEAAELLERVRDTAPVAGVGFTGLTAAPQNADELRRFTSALGLQP
jgi:arginase